MTHPPLDEQEFDANAPIGRADPPHEIATVIVVVLALAVLAVRFAGGYLPR